jgi:integrase
VKRRAARAGILAVPKHLRTSSENVSKLHPHALRRTWATIQRNKGVSLADIAEVLRHESVETTRRHYAFADDQTKCQTVLAFNV